MQCGNGTGAKPPRRHSILHPSFSKHARSSKRGGAGGPWYTIYLMFPSLQALCLIGF